MGFMSHLTGWRVCPGSRLQRCCTQ